MRLHLKEQKQGWVEQVNGANCCIVCVCNCLLYQPQNTVLCCIISILWSAATTALIPHMVYFRFIGFNLKSDEDKGKKWNKRRICESVGSLEEDSWRD